MRRLSGLLAAEAAAVAATQHWSRVYREDLGVHWLITADLHQLLLSALHLGAWLAAWWVALGTLHELAVTLLHRRRGGARPRRLAPRWAQRIISQAVGTLLTVGVLAAPAGAATTVPPADATPPAMQVVAPPVPILGFPQVPGPPDGDLPGVPTPPPTTPQPTGLPPTIAEQQSASEGASHQVAAGENLWVIARATISGDPDRPPTDREVHAYWVRLIAANDFSSGNPDLIHPGEVLRLPPLSPGAADGPGAAP